LQVEQKDAQSITQRLIEKIQNISLENTSWVKVSFNQDEVQCLKELLKQNNAEKLGEKLLLNTTAQGSFFLPENENKGKIYLKSKRHSIPQDESDAKRVKI
jgi:hypothetical protein